MRNRQPYYKFAHFLLKKFSSKKFPLEEMDVEYTHTNEKLFSFPQKHFMCISVFDPWTYILKSFLSLFPSFQVPFFYHPVLYGQCSISQFIVTDNGGGKERILEKIHFFFTLYPFS